MPGSTSHDIITTCLLPPVTCTVWYMYGWQAGTTCGLSFAFAGYMFNGDLDLMSTPYKRWGPFRFIIWPYLKVMPHRSLFSHGPLIGTAVRLVWLAIVAGLISTAVWGITYVARRAGIDVPQLAVNAADVNAVLAWGRRHTLFLRALVGGLEAGAMSHTGADVSVSLYKRVRRWFRG